MIINTTAGKTYAVTPQTDCTVSTPDGVLIASCPAGEQTLFVAPCAEVEVNDDAALVTESFKGAPAGLSAVWGSIKKVSASLASKLNVSIFNAHKADTTVHVTDQEREMWSGKQDNLTDEAGNMTLAGALTTAATINANGGINIPAAVAPRLTGAVTNHELVDYLVDRVVRTAPFMTRISGLELADFYDKSQSTSPLTLYPYSGEVRLNGPTGANNVSKAVFAGPGGHSIIVPPTQCGPYYYQKHVTVISSSSLLCMSYLTSPGAMVQMKLGVSDDAQHYGVRLRNDDGAAYYELFYKDVADDQETVAVREPVPKDVNLYRGDHSAQSRLNSLVIYVPGNFNGTSRTAVKFGQWSMTVPFALFNNAQLELSAKTGNVAINYYGAGLGVSIGSIHQLALDYQEQFVPTLNNAAYQS